MAEVVFLSFSLFIAMRSFVSYEEHTAGVNETVNITPILIKNRQIIQYTISLVRAIHWEPQIKS